MVIFATKKGPTPSGPIYLYIASYIYTWERAGTRQVDRYWMKNACGWTDGWDCLSIYLPGGADTAHDAAANFLWRRQQARSLYTVCVCLKAINFSF